MFRQSTPVVILASSAALAGLLVCLFTVFALRQPWLGIDFTTRGDAVLIASVAPDGPAASLPANTRVITLSGANGDTIPLQPRDLLEEPDVSETYVALAEFFARQTRLASALRSGEITLTLDDGSTHRITPAASRPLRELPPAFWVQLFVGATSFLVGCWVWSLRRADLASRILAAVGAATLTFSFAASAYSTRELAIDGGVFRVLSALNHFGALGFGACMIALFLTYPKRLVSPRTLLLLPAVFGTWWLIDTLQIVVSGPPTGSHLPTFIEMIGILVAAGLQSWKTRGDPRARAALRWFGLSVAVGAGAFVFLVIAPNLFGAPPVLSQGYAFLFFLLVFVGVALGVARYRLFELETWAFRILFYLGGVALLLALDSVLVFAIAMDRAPALSIALLVTVLLYLPLRELLGRRLLARDENRESLFRGVMDVALTAPGEDQGARWQTLLRTVFDPLRIAPSTERPAAPAIRDDGIALLIPAIAPLPPLALAHARGGRRLFSSRDAARAAELCAMLRHAVESRTAYEKGVAEERARIARDMHDNIGAQLLSALHSPAADRKDTKIRETLSDLRSIINNAAAPGLPLEQALAEIRHETAERLAAANLDLDWRVIDGDASAELPATVVHALRSILRETVSNTLRHAQARRVSILVEPTATTLAFTIADDGVGLPAERPASAARSGNGLGNIRARLAALGGTLEIADNHPGLRFVMRLPLPRA